jgi:cytoskeleton protein RodZ
VGADPEPLVREYDSSHSSRQGHAAASRPGPPAPLQLSQGRRLHWGAALLVALAVVAGLVIYHVVASRPAGRSTAAGREPAATAGQAPHQHPAAKNTPAPPPASHALPGVVISVTAVNEPCWADLTTPSGATIFQGILDPGTTKTWAQRQAVILKLGNPGAVTLTVNGKRRIGLGSEPATLSLGPGQGNPG